MYRCVWGALLTATLAAACGRGRSVTLAGGQPAARVRPNPFDTMPPNMAAAQRMAGCYRVMLGPWSDERAVGAYVMVPPLLHLDTARMADRAQGFELSARTPGKAEPNRAARMLAWSPVGADSVQVLAWGNQTSSVTLFLRLRSGTTLSGTARYFWDSIALDPVTKRWLWEQYPSAVATLTPTPCR